MVRTEWIGTYPQQVAHYYGTEAEILALTGPEGAIGHPSDSKVIWEYEGGAWGLQGPVEQVGTGFRVPGALTVTNPVSGGTTTLEVTASGALVASGPLLSQAGQIVRTTLPRRVRLGKAGHSIALFLAPSTVCDCEAVSGVIPASANTNYVYDGRDVGHLWQSKNYHMVCDGGVGGNTIQQFLDRSTADASGGRKSIHDILATRPDYIWFDCMVNNLLLLTTSSTQADVDVLLAKMRLAITRLAAECAYVATPGCIAFDGSGYAADRLAAIRGWIVYVKAQTKAWAATQRNVIFIDTDGRVSQNGAFIAGMTDDGTHPNDVAGYVLGDIWRESIESLFTSTNKDPLIYDLDKDWATPVSNRPTGVATPVVTNGATLGTSSVVDGVWEQPFACPATNCTMYFEWGNLRAALVAAGLLTGDAFYTEWDFDVLSADRTPFAGHTVEIFDQVYNAANAGSFSNTYGAHKPGRGDCHIATPPLKLDRDAGDLGNTTRTRVLIRTLTIGSFILRVYPPKLRKYTSGLPA